MAVDREISREHLRQEIALVQDLAASYRWAIVPDYENLVVRITMFAITNDLYVLEVICKDYKELPPIFEFIDPDTGQRGTRHAYPRGADSFFHDSGPCICAPFNRKAYKSYIATGPHEDWKLGAWQACTANGIQWSNYSKLGDMFGLIQTRLMRPDLYKGRMQ